MPRSDLRRILERVYQLRAFIARIVDARIDGMVNEINYGKLSRGYCQIGLRMMQ